MFAWKYDKICRYSAARYINKLITDWRDNAYKSFCNYLQIPVNISFIFFWKKEFVLTLKALIKSVADDILFLLLLLFFGEN